MGKFKTRIFFSCTAWKKCFVINIYIKEKQGFLLFKCLLASDEKYNLKPFPLLECTGLLNSMFSNLILIYCSGMSYIKQR